MRRNARDAPTATDELSVFHNWDFLVPDRSLAGIFPSRRNCYR
jgi:hypothetical protein